MLSIYQQGILNCKIQRSYLVVYIIHYSNQKYLVSLLAEHGLLNALASDRVVPASLEEGVIVEKLIETTALTEGDVARVIGRHLGLLLYTSESYAYDPANHSLGLPLDVTQRYQAMLLDQSSEGVTVAMVDPLNLEFVDALTHFIGHPLKLLVITPSDLREMIDLSLFGSKPESVQDLPPTIQLVDQLLYDAVAYGASDIHLEPLQKVLRVRYRIDGRLQVIAEYPNQLSAEIITRLKVMSGTMKIAEKRLPQDGRIQMTYEDREIDFRLSSLPSHHGETVVMRILDQSSVRIGMDHMGFDTEMLRMFTRLTQSPDGMILVTGPTGAGKTTTLYSCLEQLNAPGCKIITVEDPVEYQLVGVNQVMVRPEIEMTFASALRAMLRQSPNIIMVGEIRDLETASISINASLTGHLVFSTLHTNDATSAVARLENIGVKRFLIASGIRAILAQRLVRRLCESCKAPLVLQSRHLKVLKCSSDLLERQVYQPNGCEKCRGTGYQGRIGVFELFTLDEETKLAINEGCSPCSLRLQARQRGMKTLWDDGVDKVLQGQTSIEELLTTLIPDS